MKAIIYLSMVLSATLSSCEQPHAKQRLIESEKSKVEAKEVVLNKKPDTIKRISVDNTPNNSGKGIFNADNTNEIVGFWFTPHAAIINNRVYVSLISGYLNGFNRTLKLCKAAQRANTL